MTLRLYDILENTLKDIDKWRESEGTTKNDVLDSVRERVIMVMRHIIVTPMIGSAFAYPGDVDLRELTASTASTTT